MKNLKVSTRLGLGFGLVVIFLAAVAALGVRGLAEVDDNMRDVVNNRYPNIVLGQAVVEANNQIARSVRNMVISADDAANAKAAETIAASRKAATETIAKLDSVVVSAKGRELLKEMKDARSKFSADLDQTLKLLAERRKDEAAALVLSRMRDSQMAYMARTGDFMKFQGAQMEKGASDAKETFESARMLIMALSGLAILLGIAAAAWVTRSLTRQLGGEPSYAAEVAQRVATGDLTMVVETRANDRTSLLASMKAMTDSLAKIVGEVRIGSDSISTAAQQIASGNADLSQRTEEQASSLEETASSMEELASTVKQNTESAKQANQLAASASEVAVKGGAVVGEVVETMSAINESSKKIADIIGVIDGIAFQTNILALNAAVEAARAGEQGRGFAVVASEVRTLAQRSASAAKEIKELISDSVAKVEAGTRLVDDAGKTMDEIVGSVKRVTDIMSEIAAAANEQSAGIEQVNTAVAQMDQVTQQNAALVEEAAAAAESMREQAAALGREVSIFKLERKGAAAPAARVESTPERRSPNRAKNVTRLAAKSEPRVARAAAVEPKKTGTDGEWSEF